MDQALELAQLLLRKAADDLLMARCLASSEDSPDWGIGFHVQQSVEKAIKAVLCACGVEFPRTHDIAGLLDLLPQASAPVPVARENLTVLNPFGVLWRYDEAGPTDAEAAVLPDRQALVELAATMLAWAEGYLRASDK